MIKLRQLKCSFCYKKDSEVRKLVAGPKVYICDECCAIATRIMADDSPTDTPVINLTLSQKLSRWLRSVTHYKSQATFIDPC